MKLSVVSLTVAVAIAVGMLTVAHQPVFAADSATPVLVELFTSEGCSSCPPADRFLETLDSQPIPGANVIVLSEHVDYWNHIGWKDPYSSHLYSERQSKYAQRFQLDGPYTPQMVVDGASQFLGSNPALADKAFATALESPKIPVRLSSLSVDASHILHAHVETGPLEPSFRLRSVDVYVAVALNHAETQVSGGENGGRTLTHVAVTRSLTKVGELKQAQALGQDFQVKLDPKWDSANLRLVAFLQESNQGRVVGAASLPLSAK